MSVELYDEASEDKQKAKAKRPSLPLVESSIIKEKAPSILTVKDFADRIVKTNAAYSEDFLKIIPDNLLGRRVCSELCDDLDDDFRGFLRQNEQNIQTHPRAEALNNFLKDLENKLYFAV